MGYLPTRQDSFDNDGSGYTGNGIFKPGAGVTCPSDKTSRWFLFFGQHIDNSRDTIGNLSGEGSLRAFAFGSLNWKQKVRVTVCGRTSLCRQACILLACSSRIRQMSGETTCILRYCKATGGCAGSHASRKGTGREGKYGKKRLD